MLFDPCGHAGDQGAVAQGYDNRVELAGFEQLDGDGPGALADAVVFAIFNEDTFRALGSVAAGVLFGVFKVLAGGDHGSAQRSHSGHLGRVGVMRDKDFNGDAAPAPGIGHGLAEVSRRGADDLLFRVERMSEEIRASAFEAANGVQRFHLYQNAMAKRGGEGVVDELRGVEEDGIDQGGGAFDVGQVEIGGGHGGLMKYTGGESRQIHQRGTEARREFADEKQFARFRSLQE